MSENYDEIIHRLIAKMSDAKHIELADMPNIPLYMDQLTTFMDERLQGEKRTAADPILTKTMINNYTKNKLLPPPDKKKYSLEHMLLLNFIYYYKSFLSIGEIKTLLAPFSDGSGTQALAALYQEMTDYAKLHSNDYAAEAEALFDTIMTENPKSDAYLNIFRFVSRFSAEVYLKKQLIERLVRKMEQDELLPSSKPGRKNKKS